MLLVSLLLALATVFGVSAAKSTVASYPPPGGGSCVLVPNYGDADATVFSVTCENWSDYFQSTPLTYEYQWWGCDVDGDNCSLEDANPLTTTPQGQSIVSGFFHADSHGGTFRAKVIICQADGGCTTWSDIGYLADSGAPHNNPAVPPTISGNLWQGQTLSAAPGSWSNDPTSFSYQWYDCSDDTPGYEYWQRHDGVSYSGCTPIVSAVEATYTVQPSDLGSALLVQVSATNDLGATTVVDSPTSGVVVHAPPKNTALPTVTDTNPDFIPGGHPVSGDILTTNGGSWTGDISGFSYRWEACDSGGLNCQPISGATNATYTVKPSDIESTIVLRVTATNSDRLSTHARSLPSASVAPTAPSNTVQPRIDTSSPLVGTQVSANSGSWTGAPAPVDFGYRWYRCGDGCTLIAGATSQTYTPVEADFRYQLAVVVTARTVAGTVSSNLNNAVLTHPVAHTAVTPTPTPEPAPAPAPASASASASESESAPTAEPAPAPAPPPTPKPATPGRTLWGEGSNPVRQVIVSADLNDVIRTGSGHDVIHSFGGNDTIFPGRGGGFVYAGAGNDVIWAQHGHAVIYCGPGTDRVYANRFVRTVDCETVIIANNNRWAKVKVDRLGYPMMPPGFVRPYFKG
jgi:Ca2+-binding RTX toxin-like protein